jgi:hypothetical protein
MRIQLVDGLLARLATRCEIFAIFTQLIAIQKRPVARLRLDCNLVAVSMRSVAVDAMIYHMY